MIGSKNKERKNSRKEDKYPKDNSDDSEMNRRGLDEKVDPASVKKKIRKGN